MASPLAYHVEKRIGIACDQCRRRKTRCPGERPACSACTRSFRKCLYSRRPGKALQSDQPPALTVMDFSGEPLLTSQSVIAESSFRKPPSITNEAIGLYFKNVHRQPLWLFEQEDLSRDKPQSDEVIFAVLAIVEPFVQFKTPCSETPIYSAACRRSIMSKITSGTVQLSTIQSLCILSLVNFLAAETQLGWLHLSFSRELFRCAYFDMSDIDKRSAPVLRLSWSIHVLEQVHGLNSSIIRPPAGNMIQKYGDKRQPSDPDGDTLSLSEWSNQGANNVWATYAAEFGSIWGQTRHYISNYLDGCDLLPPWAPESDYARIAYTLIELEVHYPNAHRFNSVRIWEKSIEDLEQQRGYYAPWISFQLAYHTAACTLNHPFLHSSRLRKHAAQSTPTTFWKACFEKAWLHSNWIAHMIQMLTNKGFEIFDPFCQLSAAVACSVSLLFCHAIDKRLRYTAQANLEVCKRFIHQKAKHWPLCALLQSKIEALISSARVIDSTDSSPTFSINTSLVRDIFKFPRLGSPVGQGEGGIFHPSLHPARELADGDRISLNVPTLSSPVGDIDFSDAGTAAPTSNTESEASPSVCGGSVTWLNSQRRKGSAAQNQLQNSSAFADNNFDTLAQGMYADDHDQLWWSFEM